MSAICGIVNLDGRPVDPADLQTMAASSAVRGPDGCRYRIEDNAGFVHLAFHVTPESLHEQQPVLSPEGRLLLLADARLDNRDELIGKLGGVAAFSEATVTDPALLLHAFLRWGRRCVEHLLGDFVFAVWDRVKRELFLARDPLGGFSVCYHRAGNRFVFASETTAILDLPFVEAAVNEDTVIRVLANLPASEEDTFFLAVSHLAPASCLSLTPSGIRTWRYWEIDTSYRIRYRSDDDYAERLLELVNLAVESRLRVCGEVGLSLSGGCDSTLLAASAVRFLEAHSSSAKRLKTFSYVFDRHRECDEREYIQPVIDQYDLDATLIPSDDKWSFANLAQQPIARDHLWTNCFAQLPLSVAEAAQGAGCRVLMSGQYGDALFSGFPTTVADMIAGGRLGALLAFLMENRKDLDWKRDLLDHGLRPLVPEYVRRRYRRFRPTALKPFVEGLASERLRRAHTLSALKRDHPCPERLSPSQRVLWDRLFDPTWAQGFAAVRGLLYNRFGLEYTNPYFDRRIVEYVMATPSERLAVGACPRKLQRSAMRRVLPAKVWQRQSKTGYFALLREGLVESEIAISKILTPDPLILRQGWIDKAWLDRQINGRRYNEAGGFALSVCLHLELWILAMAKSPGKHIRWSSPFYWNPDGYSQ